MEELNMEKIISTLFVMGFDEIDSLFYSFLLGRIMKEKDFFEQFNFKNSEPSQDFSRYVETTGNKCKIKEGYNLETNLSPVEGKYWPLARLLEMKSSENLKKLLISIDLGEIVEKKVNALGEERIRRNKSLLTDKEIELLRKRQKMKQKVKEEKELLDSLYNQETKDIEKAIDTNRKHNK